MVMLVQWCYKNFNASSMIAASISVIKTLPLVREKLLIMKKREKEGKYNYAW